VLTSLTLTRSPTTLKTSLERRRVLSSTGELLPRLLVSLGRHIINSRIRNGPTHHQAPAHWSRPRPYRPLGSARSRFMGYSHCESGIATQTEAIGAGRLADGRWARSVHRDVCVGHDVGLLERQCDVYPLLLLEQNGKLDLGICHGFSLTSDSGMCLCKSSTPSPPRQFAPRSPLLSYASRKPNKDHDTSCISSSS
jgi:hypothetical protein